jgi:hypothetical protein
MADNGHDITMPARLGPQNAKTVLDIMVRDALDQTASTSCGDFSDGCFIVGTIESLVARNGVSHRIVVERAGLGNLHRTLSGVSA